MTRFSKTPFAMCALAMLILGCGYPEVDQSTYDYAAALYSITNRQSIADLERVSDQIAEAEKNGELSRREGAWLRTIIDDASEGKWKSSNQELRRLMEDQIK